MKTLMLATVILSGLMAVGQVAPQPPQEKAAPQQSQEKPAEKATEKASAATTPEVEPYQICGIGPSTKAPKCIRACADENDTGCIVRPHATFTPDPEYTDTARRAEVQGTVVMKVTIEPDGSVDKIEVVRSLEPTLDQAAMDAVGQWQFKPATFDGKPVPVRLSVQTTFRMYSGGPRTNRRHP